MVMRKGAKAGQKTIRMQVRSKNDSVKSVDRLQAKKKASRLGITELVVTSKQRNQRRATEPTEQEIAEGRAVARALFDPSAAAAAREAFLERQQPSDHV